MVALPVKKAPLSVERQTPPVESRGELAVMRACHELLAAPTQRANLTGKRWAQVDLPERTVA
ncbi:hypothetical protein [Sorangium sp. So ce1099]|uniref:hypothetical protein n=1 Tax=Sorangium sp. So ce1099 TaxID=3133331 RepID=UPI003F633A35